MDQEQNVMDPVVEPVAESAAEPAVEPVPQEQPTWGEYVNQVAQAEQKPYKLSYAESVYEPVYDGVPTGSVNQPKEAKKKTGTGKVILCALLVAVILIVACTVTAEVVNRSWENRVSNLTLAMNDRQAALQEQIDALQDRNHNYSTGAAEADGGMTPGQVYAQNVQAVVAITSYVEQYDFGQYGVYESFGSGFILSADGYVVSNYHVVEGGTSIEVTTEAGDVYDAELIGFDATNDIALLKVDAQDLPHVTVGSSDALYVGDQVLAIGNPLGELTSTLTVGYVSAKDRVVTTDGSTINMLQTDAAINSGNSGGPLFNMQGEVVGITTAKYSGTSSSGASIEGIGFAIPMDDVIGMIEDLRDYGYITGAYLGVMVRDVSASSIKDGLPAGAFIEEITPGYAAEKAGLKARDIITNLGGYDITNVTELTRMLRKFEAGDTVSITVYRSGVELQLSITLDEKPVEGQPSGEPEYLMPGDEGFEEWYEQFIEDQFG